MRAVWVQATRPKLSHTGAPRYTAKSIFRGEAVPNAFHHRPLTFNEAFTIFLAPFLAAATIVNLSWKENQKKDWEKKFAEIDREIEILHAREVEAWSRVQLISARNGAKHQRRSYSTTATSPAEDWSELLSQVSANEDPSLPRKLPHLPTNTIHGDSGVPRRVSIDAEKVPEAIIKRERLIALKLALQMLLHIHMGGAPELTDVHRGSYREDSPSSENIAAVAEQLQNVTADISREEKKLIHLNHFVASPKFANEHVWWLGSKIRELGDNLKAGHLTPRELVEGISQALVTCEDAPNIIIYTQLVQLFFTLGLRSLVPLVLSAIQSSRLVMDDTAFERILVHIGHSKNAEAFDWCLREITKTNSRLKLSQRWEWWYTSREVVPAPSCSDPRLLKTLSVVALSLKQHSRAEAWATILRRDNYRGPHILHLIKGFLYYYTQNRDWNRGKIWVWEAIKSTYSTEAVASRSFREFELLIFRMLSLCVACRKTNEYSQILQAAVEADIQPPTIDTPGMNNEGTKVILAEWRQLTGTPVNHPTTESEQRIEHFQNILRSSEMYKDIDHGESMERVGIRLSDGPSKNSEEAQHEGRNPALDNLRAEFEDSYARLKGRLEESQILQANLQSVLDHYVSRTQAKELSKDMSSASPDEKRFKEQQITIELLQKELLQHRKLIDDQSQRRHQEEQAARAQQQHIEKLHRELDKLKRRSSPLTNGDESESMRQLTALKHTAEIKKMEQQIANLTSIVQSLSTNGWSQSITGPRPVMDMNAEFQKSAAQSDPAPSVSTNGGAGSNTFSNPYFENSSPDRSDADSDSGYSSDSSKSSSGNFSPVTSHTTKYAGYGFNADVVRKAGHAQIGKTRVRQAPGAHDGDAVIDAERNSVEHALRKRSLLDSAWKMHRRAKRENERYDSDDEPQIHIIKVLSHER